MKLAPVLLWLCLLGSVTSYSQSIDIPHKKRKVHGTFYVTWGYHRDKYTQSDIHFKDNQTGNYDFTLYDAKASDRLDIYEDFIHEPITVPQYVLYGGYFFGNKGDWGIEIGWDHLKYIMNDNQTVHIKGTINGQYYDQDTLLTSSFVHYEHTNGNNYLMANVIKKYTLFKSPKEVHRLSAIGKLGAGALVPKTYSSVMGKVNDGPFRPSGIVFGAAAALRYDLLKYFFIEHSVKGAFVDYTAVKLYGEGRAKQNFFSVQYIFSFGFYLPTSKI
jgi:hypothetical protein